MREPQDRRLPPGPLDPVHWTPPKYLRRHAARNTRRRRLRLAFAWLVGAGVVFGFVFADGGLVSILKRRARIRHLQLEVQRLEADHQALAREIERRRDDPATIERLAREEYGMIYAGERVVRIVEVSEAEARQIEAAQERWLQSVFDSPHAVDARSDSVAEITARP